MENIKKHTRRRSQKSYDAIIEATLRQLDEKGYVKLSIEGIATQAGVGKQTIYRWWSSKAALVIEAYSEKVSESYLLPETGAIQSDLEQFLFSVFRDVSQPPSSYVMTGLISEAQTNPEIATQFFDGFIQGRHEFLAKILQSSIERGEIKADADIAVVEDMVFGPMWYRLLIGHAPLNEEFAREIIKNILAGISAE